MEYTRRQKILEGIERIVAYEPISGDWGGIGQNSVEDFLDVPPEIRGDEEIMDALYSAIHNRICATLDIYLAERKSKFEDEFEDEAETEIWDAWCNEEIEADFSDLQGLLTPPVAL